MLLLASLTLVMMKGPLPSGREANPESQNNNIVIILLGEAVAPAKHELAWLL